MAVGRQAGQRWNSRQAGRGVPVRAVRPPVLYTLTVSTSSISTVHSVYILHTHRSRAAPGAVLARRGGQVAGLLARWRPAAARPQAPAHRTSLARDVTAWTGGGQQCSLAARAHSTAADTAGETSLMCRPGRETRPIISHQPKIPVCVRRLLILILVIILEERTVDRKSDRLSKPEDLFNHMMLKIIRCGGRSHPTTNPKSPIS